MPLAEANVTDHADSASEGIFEFLVSCERVLHLLHSMGPSFSVKEPGSIQAVIGSY